MRKIVSFASSGALLAALACSAFAGTPTPKTTKMAAKPKMASKMSSKMSSKKMASTKMTAGKKTVAKATHKGATTKKMAAAPIVKK